MNSSYKTIVVLTLLAILGGAMIAGQWHLDSYESPQFKQYNIGVTKFEEGDVDAALAAFDKSLDAYKVTAHKASWLDRVLYGSPSVELAALAQSKKAILLLVKQAPEQAVLAFKESIKTNPGGSHFQKLTASEIKRLTDQSDEVKYNLELLYKQNQSMQEQEGKGKGKPKQGDGEKEVPGNQPGSMPGKGNKDDI